MGNITRAVNEDGAETLYEYDAKDRVVKITDAYGNFRLYEYDPMDRVIAETDENDIRRTYCYDAAGNLVRYTDGLENSETYSYDANGNLISKTDRNGNTYTYAYDELNRVISETDPKHNTQTFTYDANSRITAVTDKNGNTTKYILDGNGNIICTRDATDVETYFCYDNMNRMTSMHTRRYDSIHNVNETQKTLYTYDYRGLVKTEVNAAGGTKSYEYDGNGNLILQIDEQNFVTTYQYTPVNLVSSIDYNGTKVVNYVYDGTGDLIQMNDWNGTTTVAMDLLDRVVEVTDHNNLVTKYGYDAVGNQTSVGYPDGTQVDYWYDAENRVTQVQDFDQGITLYSYDDNGNMKVKEYPNYETTYYSYDACNQVIETDEHDIEGDLQYKTIYTYDANGNRTAEVQFDFDHNSFDHRGDPRVGHHSLIQDIRLLEETEEVVAALATADLTAGQASLQVIERPDTSTSSIVFPGSDVAVAVLSLEETEIGDTADDDAVGLCRGDKGEKPGNPSPPEWPENPGEECPEDAAGLKSYKYYQYDSLNRMSASKEDGVVTYYTYDTMGNLIREQSSCKITDYQYNSLNQLTQKTANNRTYTYEYDARGNRIKESSRCDSQSYFYDEANHMTQGTNWEGTTSHYVYNGLGKRVANTIANRCRTLYNYEYVVDYTDPESNDLMVFTTKAPSGCDWGFEYYQKHVYANGERIQLTTLADEDYDCIPTVYVHEDALGRAHYYSTVEAAKFAEMKYDVWGDPDYTSKIVRDGHNDYVYAVFTGHVYDVVLDIYFADARFYDASSRQWMAKDPAKDGLNWYQYCNDNPATYWDPTGLSWFDDAMDWAGETWAKKGGYFTKFACDTGHWFDKNGELLINGIGYVIAGVTAISVTAAAAPLAIPMFAASMGASAFATLLATLGVYSVAGAGFVAATTGGWDILEAFTGENYVRSVIGSDAYNLIQMGSGLYASAGTAYLSQFVVPDSTYNRSNDDADDADDEYVAPKPATSENGLGDPEDTKPVCFVAGTLVTTDAGLVAIETIEAGEVVLAANEETGEVAYKEVVRTFVNTTDEITHVTIKNAEGEQETIDSTPEHPFYVEGLGWVEASALHPGMTIWFANGTKGTVEDISNEGLEEPVTVYNFEVAEFHTYFVGECGVLVHNNCDATTTYSSWDEMKEDHKGSVTQYVKDNKPQNSPNAKKWLDNGGTIEIGEVDGTKVWTYTASTGESASYYGNNIVFSQENLNPEVGSINIGEFSGSRSTDLSKAMSILKNDYGMNTVPAGYVVHHDTQNGVLQLVEENVHKMFIHIGGHSMYK